MNQTSNYGLYVTDDSTTKFKEWREKMASEANSNMTKIDTALSEKAERSRTIEITLLASGWTDEAVPYLQTITVEGLTRTVPFRLQAVQPVNSVFLFATL